MVVSEFWGFLLVESDINEITSIAPNEEATQS